MGREDTSETMSLKARIVQALKSETEKGASDVELATLRLIECAVRDRDVCARGRGVGEGCPDADVRAVLETMVAQREVSAREHDEAGRIEDAIREREEIEVIEKFLPVPLSGAKLDAAVQDIVEDLGASKLKDVGRCMSALKDKFPGMVESGTAGKAVRDALTRS
ncbi:GatB/YqeY domain-containing protein [Hyphomonas sp.]|uniref:GatB/YqeY domain-containing protein n=1 Tax=Hyphomonas sp. TaxID=87 RepID=UPI0030F708FA